LDKYSTKQSKIITPQINFDCSEQGSNQSGGRRSVFLGHLEDFGISVEHPRELQAAAVSVGPGALAHGELRRVQTRVALNDVENMHQAWVGCSENAHLQHKQFYRN
jgi:hypothetical protein